MAVWLTEATDAMEKGVLHPGNKIRVPGTREWHKSPQRASVGLHTLLPGDE